MDIIVFVLGLIIGSFLNVCICRIPEKKSINFPPSSCCSCGHRLHAIDLIPVISFLSLRGRCRYCKNKISIQYPVIELITGALFVMTTARLGFSYSTVVLLMLICCLVVITVIDMREMIIPNEMVIACLILGICYLLPDLGNLSVIKENALGAVLGSGSFFLLYLFGLFVLKKEVIGMGDIKLLIPIGLFLGYPQIFFCLYIAILLGGIVGLVCLILKLKERKANIPFGPFIAVATVITLFWGEGIWQAYINYLLGNI